MRIAFGTDEVTTITDVAKELLAKRGHDVLVVAEGDEWSDVGRLVGEAVASGKADRGVVACWTGTGVSIAANKVDGVRAALCTDGETARGAREWNDANVLAVGLRLTSAAILEEILDGFLSDWSETRPGDGFLTKPVKLTEWTSCGGCAAKWGGASLSSLVRELVGAADPALLVGLAPFDDAAVYRVSDDVAIVSTTDFFPPLVDDPADFGAIAAANACSDVFAMGGRVVMALNVAAFPEHLDTAAIAAILGAASDTVRAAGGTIAGGHTIRSDEPIFGLAVQGIVHPDRILTKAGARPGDVLVLSKPIGTGIVLAGGDEGDKATAIAGMRRLNRQAAESLMALLPAVHAVTDVTGFGLCGHGWEMAERSNATVVVDTSLVPLYPGALAAAEAGTRTGGDRRNREYLGERVVSTASGAHEALCFDPQTSGGLLAAVDPSVVGECERAGFIVIGAVEAGAAGVRLR
jgi:selenide, water dikinase